MLRSAGSVVSPQAARASERFARKLQRYARELDGDTGSVDQLREFVAFYPPELAKVRRLVGMTPVSVHGRAREPKTGYFQTRLRDGTAGYFQRRTDDCLQAAIASCLQIAPQLVPDLRIDQQRIAGRDPEEIELEIWEKLSAWMDVRGVTIMIHPSPPTSERRWIGVVPMGQAYADHCLVMTGRDCLWDPSHLLAPGTEEPPMSGCDPADIDYGITIERR